MGMPYPQRCRCVGAYETLSYYRTVSRRRRGCLRTLLTLYSAYYLEVSQQRTLFFGSQVKCLNG